MTFLGWILSLLFTIGVIGFILGIFFPDFYNKHIDNKNNNIDIEVNINITSITENKEDKEEVEKSLEK